jgi:hypothetical protein
MLPPFRAEVGALLGKTEVLDFFDGGLFDPAEIV